MLDLGWFSTGRDRAAQDLLETVAGEIAAGRLACRLRFVFSNRAPGESPASDSFHGLVRRLGLPLITLSSRSFAPELWEQGRRDPQARRLWRLAYDREVNRLIAPFACPVVVLAGYMLVLGEELCRQHHFLNLHPALPGGPVGTWQEVIWETLFARMEEAGAMMHLVTPELDRGPAVSYFSFSLRGPGWDELWVEWEADKERTLARLEACGRGATPGPEERLFWAVREQQTRREVPLLVLTLDLLARGEVRLENHRVLDRRGAELARGYCLNREVEAWLEERSAGGTGREVDGR
ncbi:MAG: formyltransferase family protein [Moorellales bacterium]